MTPYENLFSQKEIARLFEYREGHLFWKRDGAKPKKWNSLHAGTVAGAKSGRGYVAIVFRPTKINGFIRSTIVPVHRLIFCLHHGYYPPTVDHINGDRTDNRIENLRAAEPYQNSANNKTFITNTSGHRGVIRVPSGKYQARFRFNKKRHYVGSFDSFEEACAAYNRDAEIIKGEWNRRA